MKTVSLDLHQIGLTCTGSRFEKDEATFFHEMVYRLKTLLLSERQSPFTFKEPASVWQHAKQDWFPWLLKRFPMKYKTTELSVKLLYPTLKTKLPPEKMGPVVTILVADRYAYKFDPSMDGSVDMATYREEMLAKFLKDWRVDYPECPYCKRSLFDR